jgi:TetR/AcrR family transcriptional regulator, transcriptional repressor for nem operon
VDHAAELVAQRGVAGTSLDDVLAAAGASKSQLYHYFAGRDELVEAAVAHRCAQVLGELTQALGNVATLAELEAMLGGFVAGFEQQGLPGCPIGSLASEVAERNNGARLQAAEAFDAWESLFSDALARMRERGELPGGRVARHARHRAAGEHRGRAAAEPDAQACGVASDCHGGGARARAVLPSLRLD